MIDSKGSNGLSVNFDIGRLKGVNTYTFNVNAPKSNSSFWTFSSRYNVSNTGKSLGGIRLSLEGVTESGRVIPLFSETPSSKGFVSVNLGKDETNNYINKLRLSVKKITPNAKGVFSLISPVLNAKRDFLANNNIVNYINVDTLVNLTSEQEEQLNLLYNSGHRVWVLSRLTPTKIVSKQVIKKIRSNNVLSKFKYIVNLPSLGSNRFCDFTYYKNRNGNTFEFPRSRVSKVGSKSTYNHRKVKQVIIRENCARAFSVSGNRTSDEKLNKFLQHYVDLFKQNKDLFVGVYSFDEASSFGVNKHYQEDIYQFFNSKLPSIPVVLSHSFYLGLPVLSDKYSDKWVKKYLTPHSADIFFFDHYTNLTLSKGNKSRQVRMAKFMQKNGMLNKPFIKLFGTAINKRWPCNTVNVHKNVFSLTRSSFSSVLSSNTRKNWKNIGFWAFQDREAFEKHRPSWWSTLARQKKNYCHNQFQAVLETSLKNQTQPYR